MIALDGPDGFDGYSCWANGRIPVIAFNANVSGDRQRFNLAHELGHLVLDPAPATEIEKAAHRFAAVFLVPAKTAYSELGRKRSNLSFDELLVLKRARRCPQRSATKAAPAGLPGPRRKPDHPLLRRELLDEGPKGRSVAANKGLAEPAAPLVREYAKNPELTAFMDVDLEDFHEEDL